MSKIGLPTFGAEMRRFVFNPLLRRIGEMPEQEQKLAETAATEQATETEATTQPQEAPQAETDEARTIADLQRQLKNKSEEAARLHKKIQQAEEAELSEMEKLQKQLADAQASIKQHQRADLQRQAAKDAGLPDEFASRLTGETLDEMLEDAKGLAALIPKPKPSVSTTNPPAGQPRKPTKEEWDAFLYGGGPLPTRS